ncbi:hypothetical protein AGMMS50293_02650 [Spirochaetia bacterium]|nr:hypothetical protein AGMMS50293_02650 [Spirochaetia bacterium]
MNRLILPFCLILFLTVPLFSQSTDGQPSPDSVLVINSFKFDIKGRTRPDALIYKGELQEGEELKGQAGLEKFIKDKTQVLLNQRVLEKVEITYTIGEQWSDGKYPVDLFIAVVDTWNIIAIPYPKYDSNSGFELTIKARDYNFLGTMNPLKFDLGYRYDQNERNSVFFEIDSDTPFKAFGYNWSINFDHFFNYRPDVEEPYYYKNVTGLSMELPFKTTTFTFGLEESFILNEENADRDKPFYGNFQNGLYMASRPYISWKIPTGLEVGEYGDLIYTPEISATFNHEVSRWPLNDIRKGPFMTLKHTIGFDRINWIGNYRQGFDVSMDNSYNYDFFRLNQNKEALSVDLSISGISHFIITDNFGISAFLRYRHWFYHDPGYYDQAGDALRGILDRSLTADYMLSLNLDFPFRVLQFLPSQWFGKPKLRFFDFDLHVSPIIDLALYHNPVTNTSFSFKNMLASGGLEVIVFPAFMRSLYIRASLAWNFVEQINNPNDYYLNPILPVVPHLPSGRDREIFIGIGHHY